MILRKKRGEVSPHPIAHFINFYAIKRRSLRNTPCFDCRFLSHTCLHINYHMNQNFRHILKKFNSPEILPLWPKGIHHLNTIRKSKPTTLDNGLAWHLLILVKPVFHAKSWRAWRNDKHPSQGKLSKAHPHPRGRASWFMREKMNFLKSHNLPPKRQNPPTEIDSQYIIDWYSA